MTVQNLKKKASQAWKKFLSILDARPLLSFFGFLGLLLVLVIIGSLLRKPAAIAEKKAPEPKLVESYGFGDSPKMTFSAKVEKSGVISIYAQAPGIVSKVNLTEGQKVGRGQTVVSLSSNYQGGNTASLSRQIAQKTFDSTVANFDLQKDMIAKQRDLAEKGNIQAEQMREISRKSLDDTRASISLNETIIASLDTQITTLQNTNVNGSNDAAILGAQQGKAGALAGLSQLRSALRLSEYSSDEEKTPAQMADVSKDLTLRQLDMQERGLVLSKDLSELSLKLARVGEGMMFPASPCGGTVERVHVKVGQNINPGTLIATIKADSGENSAVVLVPREIASKISRTEESEFMIAGKKVTLLPRFVSTEATDGNLYSVLYAIPPMYSSNLTNSGSLQVRIPMGSKKIVIDNLSIPLDSVYQTTEKSYVYVVNGDKAQVKEVELGEVSGSYVSIKSGLSASDKVVISRNVQEGDRVRTQ